MYTTTNLQTFRILYLVKGILNLIGSLLFLVYAVSGIFLYSFSSKMATASTMPRSPYNYAFVFLVIGIIGFVVAIIFGLLNIFTAKYLKEGRKYKFIFVISVLNCLTGVLGILLGVFTILELNKPQVKEIFLQNGEETF